MSSTLKDYILEGGQLMVVLAGIFFVVLALAVYAALLFCAEARRARRANAVFSDPWSRRQPWLELEQGAGAGANRTADEEILDVALAAQMEGATVLCTRDTAWKATDGVGTPTRTQINFRTGATKT